jgi:hemolysin III
VSKLAVSKTSAGEALIKPRLRGYFHQESFYFALGASLMLLFSTTTLAAFVAKLIYCLSLTGLLGVSALYHRVHWLPAKRVWMKRLDHSFIFILIAGTGTPIIYLGLPAEFSGKLLLTVWVAALAGVAQSLFFIHAPKWLSAILYIGVGWVVLPYLGDFYRALGTFSVGLILGGGVIYSLGAVVYALKKPNPYPRVFGYHEIFHLFVTIAATMHFMAIARL